MAKPAFRFFATFVAFSGFTGACLIGAFAMFSSDAIKEVDLLIYELSDEAVSYIDSTIAVCEEAISKNRHWLRNQVLHRESRCSEFAGNICLHIIFKNNGQELVQDRAKSVISDFICKATHVLETGELGLILMERYDLSACIYRIPPGLPEYGKQALFGTLVAEEVRVSIKALTKRSESYSTVHSIACESIYYQGFRTFRSLIEKDLQVLLGILLSNEDKISVGTYTKLQELYNTIIGFISAAYR